MLGVVNNAGDWDKSSIWVDKEGLCGILFACFLKC